MGIFTKVRLKFEELLGRAERVYGESHGDDAATLGGEALEIEAEETEAEVERQERLRKAAERHDDDGAGAGTR
jgi:hypothetical protein